MSIFEELLEEIDNEMKEGAGIFDELSVELQKKLNINILGDVTSQKAVNIRAGLVGSLTGDELINYLAKKFQEITDPGKSATVIGKIRDIALTDLAN